MSTLSPQMKRVQQARTALLLTQPFFGVLALRLRLSESDHIPTAATDGNSLIFNPKFVESLTNPQLQGVIAHEVLHCSNGHPWRKGKRHHMLFNIAADLAINPILKDAGFELPSGVLMDPQYAGKWAEWIYDRLPIQEMGQGKGQGGKDGEGCGWGEVMNAPDSNPDSADGQGVPTEEDWRQATVQSANAAKMRGNLPACIARLVDMAMQPQVNWRSVLRRFVQETAKNDYTWRMPNVRYMPSGLYLPSLHSEQCGRFAIGVDTSGSIDAVTLNHFAAELQSIADEMHPSSVDVLYCDAKVHRVDSFERGECIQINAIGGGGTSFKPVFDYLEKDPPTLLIYFTDLMGDFPASAPEYPVMWASYGARETVGPFGETIPID